MLDATQQRGEEAKGRKGGGGVLGCAVDVWLRRRKRRKEEEEEEGGVS